MSDEKKSASWESGSQKGAGQKTAASGKVSVSEPTQEKPKRAARFTEKPPVNEWSGVCQFCAAQPGQAHGRGCPVASGWVDRERAFLKEHGE